MAFTDGSMAGKHAAWAVTFQQGGAEIAVTRRKLAAAEVFDTELQAITEALLVIRALNPPTGIVFSDSQAAIRACRKGSAGSSEWFARKAHEVLTGNPNITLEWCPGHQGVNGNDWADALAETSLGPWEPVGGTTAARAYALAKRRHVNRLHAWWAASRPKRYQALGLGPFPDLLGGSRHQVFQVLAHRTGHGPFVSHAKRIGLPHIPKHYCGTPQEVQHISYCPALTDHRSRLRGKAKAEKRPTTTEYLYRMMIGEDALANFPFLSFHRNQNVNTQN